MRNWLVLPLWASLGLVAFACDDDKGSPAPADGGTDSPAPTSTTTPLPDADVPDTFVPKPDAGPLPGPVSALVTDEKGAPSPGTEVYFTEPGGTVVKVLTGADGKATHTMFAGGSLTVNYIQISQVAAPNNFLTTVAEVAPGDLVHVPAPTNGPVGSPGQVTGTLANAPMLDGGSVSYAFEPYCGGSTIAQGPFPQAFTINLSADCVEVSTGKLPFLATARDTNGVLLAYAPVIVSNPDGGAAVANVAAGDWLVPVNKQMTFTGALAAGWTSAYAQVQTPRNGQVYLTSSTSSNAAISAPLSYATTPVTFSPNVESRSSIQQFAAGEMLSATHYQRIPSLVALAEDYTKFLPRIHDLKFTGTLAPVISWQTDSPLPADGFGSMSNITGTHTPDGGTSSSVYWQIVFPVHAATTQVNVPALPPELAAQVSPDGPWQFTNQIIIGASAQAPYLLARQYPRVLSNPEQFASLVPVNVTYDLRTTSICVNCGD
jgi:hypothetical protein